MGPGLDDIFATPACLSLGSGALSHDEDFSSEKAHTMRAIRDVVTPNLYVWVLGQVSSVSCRLEAFLSAALYSEPERLREPVYTITVRRVPARARR